MRKNLNTINSNSCDIYFDQNKKANYIKDIV